MEVAPLAHALVPWGFSLTPAQQAMSASTSHSAVNCACTERCVFKVEDGVFSEKASCYPST